MRKIYVSDYTLALSAAERSNALLFREKIAVVSCVDQFGADYIELAEIKNPKEDAIVNKTICDAVKSAYVCIPAGTTESSVSAAYESIKNAFHPSLQIILPVSTVQMEYMYHLKGNKMLVKLASLAEMCKAKCEDVEFVACDASRCDAEFLVQVCKTAENNGCSRITICDDAGIYDPSEISDTVRLLKENINIPLFVKVSNAISLGVANALSALKAGADGVKTAITGKDALITGEFASTLRIKEKDIGVSSGLKDTEIDTDIRIMKKKLGHQDDENSSYESNDNGEFISTDVTLTDLKKAVKSLGYKVSSQDYGKIHDAISNLSEKKHSISSKELEAIIATYAMQVPSTYHLESYLTTCTNLACSVSRVTLKYGDEIITGVAQGDGPIDSVFRAIEQSVGFHYELDDFQIQAITEGKEALGSTIVKLRSNGKLYSGTGISTDIVGASVRAYINALNKIVFEQK